MEFVLRFEMRAPKFGADATELYAAAIDMSAWADAMGFNCVSLGEHHGAEDGYLPSPVPFAAAIAARTKRVTIRPNPLPPLLLGGTHPAVARRAARIADGYYPPAGENWDIYRQHCLQLGRPDPGASSYPLGPIVTYITRDPETAWAQIALHAEHCVRSYAQWTQEAYGVASGPFAKGVDLDNLRASPAYQVLSPEQAVAMIGRQGDKTTFILNPLLGGMDPQFAWQGLHLFEREVWPHVRHMAANRVWHRVGEG